MPEAAGVEVVQENCGIRTPAIKKVIKNLHGLKTQNHFYTSP